MGTWVAIKMPTHLVLVSLLHRAVGSGIPLQDFKKKKKKETQEFIYALKQLLPFVSVENELACCLFWLSVAH